MIRLPRSTPILLAPGLAIYAALFAAPMGALLIESFHTFTPGRVGSVADAPLTTANYTELLDSGFFRFFLQTIWISSLTTVFGIIIAFPLSYQIACKFNRRLRIISIISLTTFIFLSAVVKTYALELTFGAVSPLGPFLRSLGMSPNSRTYIEILVGAGLLQFIIPIATLTLIGTHQNIDRRLVEAAQALGAPSWRAHLLITLPLAIPGLLSASLLSFTYAISAFVIPMILGKGRVLFLSNLIYNRFSEIANYPSGASISIVTLILCLVIVYLFTRITSRAQRQELKG